MAVQQPSAPAAAEALTSRLGVDLDPDLLVLALTHRSFAYENGGLPSNERLEFLGDSVLGIVVTDRLYRDHPDLAEGELAKIRAATVSQRSLAAIARELGLGQFILLGRGETTTGGADKDSILCDTLEALFGAIYLAHGIEVSRDVILRLVGPTLSQAAGAGVALDWKTSLQEACAVAGLGSPSYEVEGEGPDHARVFTARVVIDGQVRGIGTGTAKKHAEQEAAEAAFRSVTADAAPGELTAGEAVGPGDVAGELGEPAAGDAAGSDDDAAPGDPSARDAAGSADAAES